MRRRITSLLAALALLCTLLPQFALPVRAEDVSGACGNNLIWTLNRDTGALTVSGSGAMNDGWYNDGTHQIEDIPWYPYLDEIVTVTICHGVTSIGDMAFRNCTSLTGLSIAGSVTSIGGEAFYGCTALEEISIPYGVTSIGIAAFSGCSGLLEPQLNLPDSVTTIGDYSFQDCNLEFASIPSSVTSIGYDAFCCYDLWWVEIYNPECAIDSSSGTLPVVQAIIGYPGSTAEAYAEANLLTFNAFGDYLKTFEEGLTWYLDCSTGVLTITPTNPDNWMTLRPYENNAWSDYLTLINSVQIGDGVRSIVDRAFYNISNVTAVTVPESVTSIGDRAFSGSGLTDITILNPECEIYDNAYTLRSASSVTVRGYTGSTAQTYAEKYGYTFVPLDAPEETFVSGECGENVAWSLDRETGVLTISGSGAMEDYILSRGGSEPAPWSAYASEITSVVIEDGVTAIGENAFAGCENLASVTIPDSVTSIGENAFSGTALTELTVPNPACDLPDSLGLPANATITGYPGSTAQAYAEANGYTFEAVAGTPAEPWYFNEDTGLLVICSDEVMQNWSTSNRPPWYGFRNEILEVLILDGVTGIGYCAFDSCWSLTSVTIPDSVTNIGNSAFYGCISLTSVTIPDSVTSIDWNVFYGCNSLTSVTILDGVTSIEVGAFDYCTSLTSVTIPNSVTSINDKFDGCSSLAFIHVSSDNSYYYSIDGVLFEKNTSKLIRCPEGKSGSYQIPDGVTSIGQSAFKNCTSLTSVTIPDSVTSISDSMFYGCTSLRSVTIPDSVTSIGWYVFYGCTSLTSVTIPDSVTSIGQYAFYGCTSLTNVTIPDSVTSIDQYAFYGCTSLTNVTIPDSVTSIGKYAFYGCTGLTEISISNGVTSIADYMFYGCTSLTTVTIPDGVTHIYSYAFYGCTGLTSVTIPDSVLYIYRYAFYGCTGLTEITIPNSVKSIDWVAFYGCTGLTSITLPRSVSHIDSDAFFGCTALTKITVLNPACVMSDYQQTMGDPEITTICAYSGSCAQEYAQKYGYSFEILPFEPSVPESWDYDESTGKLTIRDDAAMEEENWYSFGFFGAPRPPWFVYRNEIKTATILDGVTIINRYAFTNCSDLTSVSIPDSVTSIGSYVFSGCSSLTSVTILNPECSIHNWSSTLGPTSTTTVYGFTGSTAEAYASAYGYTFVPLDAGPWYFNEDTGLLVICSDEAMQNWSVSNRPPWYDFRDEIIKISILDGVTKIGNYAFDDCSGLTSVTIPDSVTSIGACAFENCSSLSSVTIPDGVTSIGGSAFYGCTGLTSVSIPDGVTWIYGSVFSGCSSLTSVTIPDSVVRIEKWAFAECSSLTSVTIPDSVTSINEGAFYECSGLTSVTIPGSVTNFGSRIFYGCTSLESVTFLDGVTSIGGSIFWNCSNLTSVTIPDSVTSIGGYAFYGCTNLTSVTIPDNVTRIYNFVFYGCSSLTSVTIPDRVKSIDEYAFTNCSSLMSVTILNPNCTILDRNNTLGNASTTTIYGYIGSTAEAYATRYGYTFLDLEAPATASGTCGDDLTWMLDRNTGVLTISGSGAMDNWGHSGDQRPPWYDYRVEIKSVAIPDTVTSIGTGAFQSCTNLSSMTIPDSVTSIPGYLFYLCTGLTSVTIPDSVTRIENSAFEGCTGLTGVTIPDSVTHIGFRVFYDCTSLTSITIPNSVTSISNSETFFNCTSLSSIHVASDNSYYYSVDGVLFEKNPSKLFRYPEGRSGAYQVPDGVTSIGACSFLNCTGLTSVAIPDTVTTIDNSAFNDCTSLTSVTIPNSVTSIGSSAFDDCSSLTSVTIPDSVTSIGVYAFYRCSGLTSVSIPDGVTRIHDNTFFGCSSLTSVTIPDSVTSIGSKVFSGCSSLTSVRIPDNVTSIGDSAFSGCVGLTGMTLPDNVTSIGDSAFSGCVGLTSMTLPESLTSIGKSAFNRCSGLTSLTIPESVTSIGKDAFSLCSGLKSVTVLNPGCNINYSNATLGSASTTTIYGYLGSTVHSYAERYGYAFVPLDGYLLHFDANGGDGVMADLVIAYDTNANLTANAFSRTGYSFNGWNTAADGSGTSHGDGASVYNLTSETEITLYAQWKAKTYTVRYHANGGEGAALENQRATYDAPFVLRENTFTRTGYTAAGWNTAADGSGTAYESGQPAANLTDAAAITLYAQYVPNTYAIVFNANGGEGEMAAQQMTYGVYSALTQNAFTRTGFTFDGWNTARDGSGTAYPDKRTVRNLATEGSVTLYAQWKPNNYTILLVANGGEGDTVTVRATYNLPVALPANTFTRTAYKFAGWNTAADGSGTPFTDRQTVRNLASGGTVKLYAQWKPNAYTIMFVTNGGSGSTVSQKTFYDLPTALEPNTFTKTGYSFAKWNTAYDGSGTSYSDGQTVKNLAQSGTFKLYAQWKANKYTVTFDANGGTGTMVDQTMTYNTSAALRLNTYTKTGYTFTGWNTAADGSGTAYANGKTVRNLAAEGTVTLYAQWTPNTITVRFYPNGGVGSMDNQVMTYDVPAALNANNFSKEGYTFAGWKTGAGATYTDGQVVENLALKGVVNLYAQWTR